MSFLEPLFLAGLIAAGIPVAIHLINRRKATRQAFPAMRLLFESNKKEARSIKVRQWVLLSLRVLVVVALALALAKPFFLSDAGVTASERLPTAVVFVVDDSASMGFGQWWKTAGEQFGAHRDQLRPWDEAALISTSSLDGPVARLTSDHAELDEAFDELAPSAASTDLSEALVAARDLLNASQLPGKRIVVISDFARGGFPRRPAPKTGVPYDIERVSVRGDAPAKPANLGVSGVDYHQQHGAKGSVWTITARVKNWGEHDQNGVELGLTIDGQRVGTGLVDVAAGESATHQFRHRFDGQGLRRASVELVDGDAFEVDDRYDFVVDLREKINVLLVNGEPSSVVYADELFFVTRALNPGHRSDSTIVPHMTTVDGLAGRELADFDVVVVANATTVAAAEASKLADFVDAGGGLLLTMGDQVDADAWNHTMADVLPKPLRGTKRLAAQDDPDAPVKITHLGGRDRSHPVFRGFDMPGGAAMNTVGVYSYMLLEPGQSAHSREVLAYKDKAPALVERSVGDGRVMLLTTTVDREWTDLPVRTVFLPLIRRTIQYLARRATSAGKDQPTVGSRVRLDVSGLVDERAIIRGPHDTRLVLEPTDGQVSFVPKEVGFYEVWADSDRPPAGSGDAAQGTAGRAKNRLDALAFAVNATPDESRLTELGPAALDPWTKTPAADAADPKASGAGADAAGHASQRRVNIWPDILFAITMLLLLESLLGARRSVLAQIWRRLTFQADPDVEV